MTVHFIGAGPGAPDLITLRGRDLIARSPVCLYAGSLIPRAFSTIARRARESSIPRRSISTPSLRSVSRRPRGPRMWRGFIPAISRSAAPWASNCGASSGQGVPYTITPGVPAFAAAAAALERELTLPGVAQSLVLTRTSGRASPMPERETLANFAATGATLAIHLSIHALDDVVARTHAVLRARLSGSDRRARVVAGRADRARDARRDRGRAARNADRAHRADPRRSGARGRGFSRERALQRGLCAQVSRRRSSGANERGQQGALIANRNLILRACRAGVSKEGSVRAAGLRMRPRDALAIASRPLRGASGRGRRSGSPKSAAREHAPVAADDNGFKLARLSGEDAAAVAHAPSATSAGKSKPAASASSNACRPLFALAIAATSDGAPPGARHARRAPQGRPRHASNAGRACLRQAWSSLPGRRRWSGAGPDARADISEGRRQNRPSRSARDPAGRSSARIAASEVSPVARADVVASTGARDIDAAVDRVDPGRARIGDDDSGRAEDRQAAEDAKPSVGGALGDLLTAGNGDFDDRVDARRQASRRLPRDWRGSSRAARD